MEMKQIKNIQQNGKKAQGQKELIKHLEGRRLTLKQAVLARCYDCTCHFADGKQDCRIPKCPLYPFMAYNESRTMRKNS